MNIPWDQIIAAGIEMIKLSLEKESAENVQGRLLDPGFIEWLRFRAALVKRGIRGRELEAAMEAARRYVHSLKSAEDQDWAYELVAQARAS